MIVKEILRQIFLNIMKDLWKVKHIHNLINFYKKKNNIKGVALKHLDLDEISENSYSAEFEE